ncbi:hypothetical protein SISSUDRAFT_1044249 [Sistotremastrum suecicum HHB10207 ss-3]|uniref:F-box domain-containing protein n=1 Tax=Sistotremastrum suecicum HHB10207 ss-3 TaxID=1314776 RepID=A0A166F7J3_9AGAM|nr:hypothetical protein SISSUDRAFT_1044249 [Sistotremastrum suecicum HHB10207 ss-3]
MDKLPPELWRLILRYACVPLTEDVIINEISQGIRVQGAEISFSPGYRTKRFVILTCRAWARIAIPYLYDLIAVPYEIKHRIPDLLQIIPKTIPKFLQDDSAEPPTYGRFVKAIVVDKITAPELLDIISHCPNVRWIYGPPLHVEAGPQWTAVQTSLASLRHLEALQMSWAQSREQTFELATPIPRLSSLKFVRTHFQYRLGIGNILPLFEMPMIRQLAIDCGYVGIPGYQDEVLLRFLERHGSKLDALFISGFYQPASKRIDIPLLCPHLTHLAVFVPWALCTSEDEHILLPSHPTLNELSITFFSHRDLSSRSQVNGGRRKVLEAIQRRNFPMLRRVHCQRFSMNERDREVERSGRILRLPLWWKRLMQAWEEDGIKFCLLSDESEVTLQAVCENFPFEE